MLINNLFSTTIFLILNFPTHYHVFVCNTGVKYKILQEVFLYFTTRANVSFNGPASLAVYLG